MSHIATPAAPRAGRALAVLDRCLARPRRTALLLALLGALPIPLLLALMPHLLVNYTHHDIFIPLDAAWRTLNGQWPHTDYYTPLGLTYTAAHGAAAALWGLDGRVLDRVNLLALPVVLAPAMLLGWRRLGALPFVLLTVLLAVLVASPVFLDGPERLVPHLADYNRWGGGLCAAVCLWALCPPDRASRGLDAAEAVTLAVGFVALFDLKLTFFVLAAATVAVGCATGALGWRRAAVVAVLAGAGLGVLELLHPGLLLAYLADVRRAGAANTQLFRGFYTGQAAVANLLPGLLVGALAALCVWLAPGARWRIAGIVLVAGGCVLVATQNFGAFSAPLVVLVLLLAQILARSGVNAPALAAALLATVPFLLTHLTGTAYLLAQNPARGATIGTGQPGPLSDVVWLPNPLEPGFMPADATVDDALRWHAVLPAAAAAAVLRDGYALLLRDGLAGKRIANLSFSNPFPVAFRAPPPHGVALWWDENRTFTTDRLTPEAVLGDAEVVMVPRLWWHAEITAALLTVAQPRLSRDYLPHESRYWTAWVHRPPG